MRWCRAPSAAASTCRRSTIVDGSPPRRRCARHGARARRPGPPPQRRLPRSCAARRPSTRATSRARGWISATRRFVPHVLAIVAGTTVDFPNNDKTYHNVFSLSKAKSFDLGRYAAGRLQAGPLRRPGIVRVFCEIHSHMSAFILVFAHRYFAVTDDEGRYRLDNVPPGTYTVMVWNETVRGDAAAANGHDARSRRRRRRRLHGPMNDSLLAHQPHLLRDRACWRCSASASAICDRQRRGHAAGRGRAAARPRRSGRAGRRATDRSGSSTSSTRRG